MARIALFHGGAQLRRFPQFALADLLFQPVQNFLRRANSKIGGDQGCFQVIKHRLIQSRLALNNLFDPFNQLGFGGGDGLLQPIQETGFLLFIFFLEPNRETIGIHSSVKLQTRADEIAPAGFRSSADFLLIAASASVS